MARIEEWRVQRRDTEEWMQHRQLPEELRERIRRFDQYKWLAARGVDEREILQELPLDLRREIQKHLCLKLVRRVSNCCFIFIFLASCNIFLCFIILLVFTESNKGLIHIEIEPFSLFSATYSKRLFRLSQLTLQTIQRVSEISKGCFGI